MAETSPSRVSYDFVTRAIARTLGNPGKGYYALLALAVALLGVGIGCLLFLLRYGLGLAGYSHPVYWAVYITCFVFWVGIAHSGTLISAILFLFRSGWRTAVYRTAEAMTVFAVMTAAVPADSHRAAVVFLLAHPLPERARLVAQLQVAAHLGRVRDRDVLHRLDGVPDHGADPRHRGGARRGDGVAQEAVRHHFARLAWHQRAVAPLHTRLSLSRGARDPAGVVRAQRGVVGLRDGDRTRLARDVVCAVFRGRRDLFGRGHGDHAARADPQVVPPRGPDHRPPFREPRQALSPDGPDRQLLVLRRELHGVVRRSPCGACGVLVPGVRAVLVGELDHEHLQRDPPLAAVVQEDPYEHSGVVRYLDLREHRHVVRALRDHRRVARGGAVRAVCERHVQPDVGRLGNHGGQLRLVLHVVPLVREKLPRGVDLRGEGSAPGTEPR